MTVQAELAAITLTANAKVVGSTKGTDMNALMVQAKLNTAELQKLMKQIVAHHPTGGGDAANLTALNAIVTELS